VGFFAKDAAMMQLANGIRRHGFKKWYERELLRGHAHLVVVIFCCLGLMMALEGATRFRSTADQLFDLMAVVVCTGAGLWALRRYLTLLLRAESIAHQADCPHCKAYGRLELAASPSLASAAQTSATQAQQVAVRCRACGHEWPIYL
jgi:ABC-type nickel/cobalt efflux system permease component RcnA